MGRSKQFPSEYQCVRASSSLRVQKRPEQRDRQGEHRMRVVGRTATCMRVKSLSMGSSSRRGNANLSCSRRQRTVMKADVIATQYATALAKEAEFNEFSTNFLCLLVDKQRITQVSDICDEFETIYCDVTDTEVATVTSAAALDNDQQFEIAKKLQSLTGAKNIKLKPKVD